jgi:CheY-like chemotaxis protein
MTQRSAVILMVEDDADDIFFMKRSLRKAKVSQRLKVVRDGELAIQYLAGIGKYSDRRRHPLPCMILLDFKLPKTSGLDVLRWLRTQSTFSDLPVFMISSSGEPRDRSEAQRAGVDAYRVKSVSIEDLVLIAHEVREKADEHCRDADPCPAEMEEED